MFRKSLLVFIFLYAVNAHSKVNVKKYDWGPLEVYWIEDERVPLYDFKVHFLDGALSDKKGFEGTTSFAFDLLTSGTRRYSSRDISDNLEFFGVGVGTSVTHESVTFSIGGLIKDMIPTVKKICHLFDDVTYSKKEIKSKKKIIRAQHQNILNSPGSIAARALRELSLEGSPYAYPVNGKLKDLKRISSKSLKSKMDYFNKKVKKRVYISGPKEVLKIKPILLSECGWGVDGQVVERRLENINYAKRKKNKIYLVTVPKASQVRVAVGRLLGHGEHEDMVKTSLLSEYLSGGFQSVLMKELRTARGLTYSVSSAVGSQRQYGRAVINTFTKSESTLEMLEVLKEKIQNFSLGVLDKASFEHARGSLVGSFPFLYELTSTYLGAVLDQKNRGRDLDEIASFPSNVKKVKASELLEYGKEIFDWDKQTVIVVGEKKLYKKLIKLGPVEKISYKRFL